MEMHVPETVKEHWPYYVGGAVGLYLVLRIMRNRAASSAPSPAVAVGSTGGVVYAGNSGPTAGDVQMHAIDTQAQLTAQKTSVAQGIALATLDANTQLASQVNAANYLQAQGQVAAQVGSAAGQLVAALQAPTIAAINGSNVADALALSAAANVTDAGFATQASMVKTASDNSAFTVSALNHSEDTLTAGMVAAQQSYASTVNAGYKAASDIAVGTAQANAAGVIGQANAESRTQVGVAQAQASQAIAQAQASAKSAPAQAASDSSMFGAIASIGSDLIGALL